MGGCLYIKPSAGCQISTLIFEISFVERDLYKYPMKNISTQALQSVKGAGNNLN
jgi:hypothetical protein